MDVAVWFWFVIAWAFVIAVMFSRWFARERADQEETERQLAKTKPYTGSDHWGDA